MKAKIDCSVYDCTYNSDGLCAADEIRVGGDTAQTSDDTECDTFTQDDSMTNSVSQNGADGSIIYCEAENCLYYENNKCDLSSIEVEHCNSAGETCTSAKDTCCDSFQCK